MRECRYACVYTHMSWRIYNQKIRLQTLIVTNPARPVSSNNSYSEYKIHYNQLIIERCLNSFIINNKTTVVHIL